MKRLLLAAISALTVAGVVRAVDSTHFGAMQVVSQDKRTLVAIPWVATKAGGGDIAVSNLVLTANLTAGDTLDVLGQDGTSLNRWTLRAGAGGVLYWASGTMVGETWTAKTPKADQATVKFGSSVILIRQKPTNDSGDAIPFFVMGQVASTGPSTTITSGTADKPCYNMIAPPSAVAQSLNGGEHGATWEGDIAAADRIYVPNSIGPSVELVYTVPGEGAERTGGKSWCRITEKTKVVGGMTIICGVRYDKYEGTIPVGTGVWYVSRGGNPTVTWNDLPIAEQTFRSE